MKSSRNSIVVLALVLAFAVSGYAQEETLGTVLSTNGNVVVKRAAGEETEKADTGMQLRSGDTIWTRADSSVALKLQTEKGPRISKLGADAELIIGEPDVDSESGGKYNILSGLSGLLSDEPVEEELAVSGVIRPIDESTRKILMMPINTLLLDATPTIQWKPVQGAMSYQVTIRTGTPASGSVTLLEKSVTDTSLSLDKLGKPMERGQTYTVVVKAKTLEGDMFVSKGAVHPISEERVSEIRKELKNPDLAQLDETAQTYILGQYLRSHHLYADAHDLYSNYLEKNPNEEFAKKALEQIEINRKLKEPAQ